MKRSASRQLRNSSLLRGIFLRVCFNAMEGINFSLASDTVLIVDVGFGECLGRGIGGELGGFGVEGAAVDVFGELLLGFYLAFFFIGEGFGFLEVGVALE